MKSLLEIKDLKASAGDRPILHGVSLSIAAGETHAIMGPNGSGKSTMASVIAGHPDYEVTGGDILLNGESILDLSPDERARAGLFLAFQYPVAVPGVTVARFLRRAVEACSGEAPSAREFLATLRSHMKMLEMDQAFLNRALNEGFSGGEKKRLETLQMLTLNPRLAIMDETDSGLDIDALKVVSRGVNHLKAQGLSLLLITHYQRILNYIHPDHVHVLMDGRVVHSGDHELVETLEDQGYDWLRASPEAERDEVTHVTA